MCGAIAWCELRRLCAAARDSGGGAARRGAFVPERDALAWQPSVLWASEDAGARAPPDDPAPSHGRSQVVLEGALVNHDVTTSAATLALTLMFLKTNDSSVAAMFDLPDTVFGLDFVRPSFVLLRVVARALIMWDKVEPTREWAMAQMPRVIRTSWPDSVPAIRDALAEGREYDHEAVLLAHLNAIAGACLAIGIRYAGAPRGAPLASSGALLGRVRMMQCMRCEM
jgi:hypothetical protein